MHLKIIFILFGHEGEDIIMKCRKKYCARLLSGEPFMNLSHHMDHSYDTESEIKQAYERTSKQVKFGYLEDN